MESTNNKVVNSSLQADEIQALSAIFGQEFELEKDNAFNIKIRSSTGNEVFLQVTLPENYPLVSPPQYQLSAPWMNRQTKLRLSDKIQDIYRQNIGESIVYLWVEAIKDIIEDETVHEEGNEETDTNSNTVEDLCSGLENVSCSKDTDVVYLPVIEHGKPIIDRKSVFQAHLARIVSENQVKLVIDKLNENTKIASAKHNVYAYRISLQNQHFIQDCNDDGEARAGSVLLHLLQVLDLSNLLIVVSRWFGGIHLGPDRFRHYSNAARNLISDAGLLTKKIKPSSTRKK